MSRCQRECQGFNSLSLLQMKKKKLRISHQQTNPKTLICVECGKPAEYDSPKHYCMRHWALWWNDGMGFTKLELEKEVRNLIRRVRYDLRKKGILYCKTCRSWH